MSQDKKHVPSESQRPQPLTEERFLQPAKNPPPMSQVKPPKSENGN